MFINFLKKNWLLLYILLLAAFLRLWKLDSVPPHLTPDEASFGYNAYSILKTGKDMWGETFPLIFKSFGDYRPGLYFYLTIPSIAIFGLTEFAVRFPNAVFGVLGVLVIYFLSGKMFDDKKFALLTSFMMAINPWHIYFSRGAWEPNVSLTFTLLAIYFFYRALRKSNYLIVSSFFFALTFLTYQGSKMATLIVVSILLLVYWKELILLKKKALITSVLVGLIVSTPIILSLFSGKAGRLELLSIFSYRRPVELVTTILSEGNEKIGGLSYNLFHSQTLTFIEAIWGRWFNHYSAKFLLFEGDWQNPRHSSPNNGMLVIIDGFLIILGILNFVRKKSKENLFVLLWLIFSPFSSALSRDEVHAVRALNMLVPLTILISSGFSSLLTRNKITIFCFGFLYFLNYLYFLDSYFVHLPVHNSQYWYWGYKEIVKTVIPIQDKYKTIKIQQSYDQPFIYLLFYGAGVNPEKYDASKIQKSLRLSENKHGDVGLVEKLDNISFIPIDWQRDQKEKGTLVVGDAIAIPSNLDEEKFRLIKEIKYLNGRDVAFRIVEVK